jgi:C-terminal processing protease CtpA/Prc
MPKSTEQEGSFAQPTGHLLRSGAAAVGVLAIPGFAGVTAEAQGQFALSIQEELVRLADSQPTGWIVNLQENGGGNLWPMLAGIGPLLGARNVGQFDDGKSPLTWFYERGVAGVREQNGREHAIVKIKAPKSKALAVCAKAPLAALIGPDTASSGEAIAVALCGRARFFGKKSAGLSTDNREFPLRSGKVLLLTVGIFRDRSGSGYESGITPEEEVAGDAVAAAMQWHISLPGK